MPDLFSSHLQNLSSMESESSVPIFFKTLETSVSFFPNRRDRNIALLSHLRIRFIMNFKYLDCETLISIKNMISGFKLDMISNDAKLLTPTNI